MLPSSIITALGFSFLHFSVQYGHLGWKGQPEGGFKGLGMSPLRRIRSVPVPSQIHDDHAVADMLHRTQVMGDKQIAFPFHLPLQWA